MPFTVSSLKSHISELYEVHVHRTGLLSVSGSQLATDKSSPNRPGWRSWCTLSCLLRYFLTTYFNPEMCLQSRRRRFDRACVFGVYKVMLFHSLLFFWKCLEIHSLCWVFKCFMKCVFVRVCCGTGLTEVLVYKLISRIHTNNCTVNIFLWLWFGVTINVDM